MTRPVILIGSRGMLGQMVQRYFSRRGTELVTIDERFDFSSACPGLRKLIEAGPGIVINTLGRIKQKSDEAVDLMLANALLPLQLSDRLAPGQFLVQPSTDCVFDGCAGSPYALDQVPDAIDDYGWSKRLGECALEGKGNACVVRVSIIGPDWLNERPAGLLGWFLSQSAGSELSGYTNHLWNGITTLEWCRQIEALFVMDDPGLHAGKLLQLGTAVAKSKHALLLDFQACFGTDFAISPFACDMPVYRVLESALPLPGIEAQLRDMKQFMEDVR
jgi:dTDP-4-dehydrorhamnose reductase